jgi:hypothetical protein
MEARLALESEAVLCDKVLELQQELQTTKAHILKSLLYSDFTDF